MAKRFSLLVADRDPESRESMRGILEKEGYRLFFSSSAQETIKIATEQAIHGLIIEMQMPDLSGIETLRQLRSKTLRIPSILVSSEPWKETQLEALSVGVFSFIQKPVDEEILKNSITKLLDRSWSEDALRFSIQVYQKPKGE